MLNILFQMTYLGRPILTWFLIEPISLWVSCPPFKEAAYITLVRPIIMEYTAPIWDPHLSKDTHMLDNIQRRATRFIKGDLRTSASVTKILQELAWKILRTATGISGWLYCLKLFKAVLECPPRILDLNRQMDGPVQTININLELEEKELIHITIHMRPKQYVLE